MHAETRADPSVSPTALGWITALGVGLGLRLYHLTHSTFWVDEIGVWWAARQPTLGEALSVPKGHIMAMPLHYLQAWVALHLGLDGEWLRLPDALWSAASLYLAYRVACHYVDRRTATLTVWLLALSPTLIQYAQELRFYSGLIFFHLALVATGLNALRRGRHRDWLTMTLVGGVGSLFHVYVILGLAFIYAAALLNPAWRNDRQRWRGLLASSIGLLLIFGLAVRRLGAMPGYTVPLFLQQTLLPFVLGGIGAWPLYPLRGAGWIFYALWLALVLGGIGRALYRREWSVIAWVILSAAIVGVVVVMNAYRHYFLHSRQILFLTFWFSLIAGMGLATGLEWIDRVWRGAQARVGQPAFVLGVVVLGMSALPALAQYYTSQKTEVIGSQNALLAHWHPGEIVCVLPDYDIAVFRYYWWQMSVQDLQPCEEPQVRRDAGVRFVLAPPSYDFHDQFEVIYRPPENVLYPKILWMRRR